VNFEPGQTFGTFQFAILNDHAPGGDRTLSLGFDFYSNTSPGIPATMTFTITEVDIVPQVEFLTPTSTCYSAYYPMRIPVRLSGAWGSNVTIQYDVTGGTALNGSEYSVTPGQLTFPAGSTAVQYIDLFPLDVFPGQTAILGLSNPTGGAVLGANTSQTVTFEMSPLLDFLPFQGVASNAPGTVTVTVVLSQAMPIPIQASIIPEIYSTAQAGVDYVAFTTPVVLTFAPGQTSRSFDIQVLQNPARANPRDLMLLIQYAQSLPAVPGAYSFYYLTFQP
jgi:hypothetical protein